MVESIKQAVLEGFSLFYKSAGLWLINGPTPTGKEMMEAAIIFADAQDLLRGLDYEELLLLLHSDKVNQEYAELFCVGSFSLSLYESVWKTGLVMQAPRDEVLAIMHALNLSFESPSNEPEDHAGILLYLYGEVLSRLVKQVQANADDHLDTDSTKAIERESALKNTLAQISAHMNWFGDLSRAVRARGAFFHAGLLEAALIGAQAVEKPLVLSGTDI